MYLINKKHIIINGNKFTFDYPIQNVIQKNNHYYVLTQIPAALQDKVYNNIYCLDDKANLVWQSQNLDVLTYPNESHIQSEAYVGMVSKESFLRGVTFHAHTYEIDYDTGKTQFVCVGRW